MFPFVCSLLAAVLGPRVHEPNKRATTDPSKRDPILLLLADAAFNRSMREVNVRVRPMQTITSLPPSSLDPPSVEFLSQIIEQIAHPIFVKDRRHRWVVVNSAFCRLIDVPPERCVGKSDHDFFSKEQADFFHMRDREVFETGMPSTSEEPLTIADGKSHTLLTTKAALKDDDGNVCYLVGIIHDITPLKRAEESLRAANDELEKRVAERTRALEEAHASLLRQERLAVLGQLTGGLAHQIRNPLGAILNASALLEKNRSDWTENELALLQILQTESWAANRIISDLVDYARVRPPTTTEVNLASLVDGVLREEDCEHIRLLNSIPRSIQLHCDEFQLRGALRNLVRNAIESTPTSGTIEFSCTLRDEKVCVRVTDSGPGMRPEILARLFEPLVTSKPVGLGLGLTTARALLRNQGGDLLHIPTQTGCTFECVLPLK